MKQFIARQSFGAAAGRRGRQQRGRGAAMVLVMIAVAVASILVLGFVASQTTTVSVAQNVGRHAQARAIGETALATAMRHVESDPNWRTQFPHGQWVSDQPWGGGTFSVWVEDGLPNDEGIVVGDGDLANDPSHPATITSRGAFEGVTHRVRAAVATGPRPGKLLLIVPDPASLARSELNRKLLFEAWGWRVTLFDDDSTAAQYAAAAAEHQVAFIARSAGEAAVGTKLTGLGIGVVCENAALADELRLASANGAAYVGDSLEIIDASHPITQGLATGTTLTSTAPLSSRMTQGTLASGARVLARPVSSSQAALLALEAGAASTSGAAAGRRVLLPWADEALRPLNAAGSGILRRSLEWAAAPGGPTLGVAVHGSIRLEGFGRIDALDRTSATYNPSVNASAKAIVATNSTASDALSVGLLAVLSGDAYIGVGGLLNLSALLGTITGTKGTLSAAIDVPEPAPPATLPPSQGNYNPLPGAFVIGGGTHHYDNFNLGLGRNVQITGDAVIYCDGNFVMTDNATVQLAAGASLRIFAQSITIGGSAQVGTLAKDPSRLTLAHLGNGSATIEGSAQVVAYVMSPNGSFRLRDSARLYGSLAGADIRVRDSARFTQELTLDTGVRLGVSASANGTATYARWAEQP